MTKHLSWNGFNCMTSHKSSQNGVTSVMKITITSPIIKCDATIVTKSKSSQMNISDDYDIFSDVR
jgi:UDP-N-acetylmuramoylalanine-D-glutamate ligase